MHGPATFYIKLTVSYIKPMYRNNETELLLPYSEWKNFIRAIPRTVSDPAFCDCTQDLASQHTRMFQMFFDKLSLFILIGYRDKYVTELKCFIFV